MKYGQVKQLNKKASKIVFGCAVPTMRDGLGDHAEVLSFALEKGINVFDTARVYGQSEKTLGKWLVNQDREKIILETKCCHFDVETDEDRVDSKSAFYDIQTSLELLKTDYVDILLLHRDDKTKSVEEIIDFMNAIIDKGFAKTIGVSNWRTDRIAKANEYALSHGLKPFVVSSPHYGLAEQIGDLYGHGCVTLTGEDLVGDRKWYAQDKTAIFAYSSLASGLLSGKFNSNDIEKQDLPPQVRKGFLSDKNIERLRRAEILAKEKGVSVAQLSLAWLFGDDMDVYTIVGLGRVESVLNNVKATEIELLKEERTWLNLENI